jgi:hypothetical protein
MVDLRHKLAERKIKLKKRNDIEGLQDFEKFLILINRLRANVDEYLGNYIGEYSALNLSHITKTTAIADNIVKILSEYEIGKLKSGMTSSILLTVLKNIAAKLHEMCDDVNLRTKI